MKDIQQEGTSIQNKKRYYTSSHKVDEVRLVWELTYFASNSNSLKFSFIFHRILNWYNDFKIWINNIGIGINILVWVAEWLKNHDIKEHPSCDIWL